MLIDEIASCEFESTMNEQIADEEFYIASKVDGWNVEKVLEAITPDGGWHPLEGTELTQSGEYHSLWNPHKQLLGGILGKAMPRQHSRL